MLLRRESLLGDLRLLATTMRFANGRNRSWRSLLHAALLGQQHLLLPLLTGARHHRPLHLLRRVIVFNLFPIWNWLFPLNKITTRNKSQLIKQQLLALFSLQKYFFFDNELISVTVISTPNGERIMANSTITALAWVVVVVYSYTGAYAFHATSVTQSSLGATEAGAAFNC